MPSPSYHSNQFMSLALEQAKAAALRGEVPVGAVLCDAHGAILAAEGNRTIETHDPTAHAEILVIRQACTVLQSQRLTGCKLYVTLEPCPMCASAISFARIEHLYYGAADLKSGGVANGPQIYTHACCHHKPEIYDGINETQSSKLLKDFFKARRPSKR